MFRGKKIALLFETNIKRVVRTKRSPVESDAKRDCHDKDQLLFLMLIGVK